jgi:hypothetical protein
MIVEGQARAAVRALEARASTGPLPPHEAARLVALRAEAAASWCELRRVRREEVPADDGDDADPTGG